MLEIKGDDVLNSPSISVNVISLHLYSATLKRLKTYATHHRYRHVETGRSSRTVGRATLYGPAANGYSGPDDCPTRGHVADTKSSLLGPRFVVDCSARRAGSDVFVPPCQGIRTTVRRTVAVANI